MQIKLRSKAAKQPLGYDLVEAGNKDMADLIRTKYYQHDNGTIAEQSNPCLPPVIRHANEVDFEAVKAVKKMFEHYNMFHEQAEAAGSYFPAPSS